MVKMLTRPDEVHALENRLSYHHRRILHTHPGSRDIFRPVLQGRCSPLYSSALSRRMSARLLNARATTYLDDLYDGCRSVHGAFKTRHVDTVYEAGCDLQSKLGNVKCSVYVLALAVSLEDTLELSLGCRNTLHVECFNGCEARMAKRVVGVVYEERDSRRREWERPRRRKGWR